MERSAAEKELSIRLYRWALQEWERELRDDFPEVRRVSGDAAIQAVRVFHALEPEQRPQLAHAMAKRFHKHACVHLNEPLTEGELQLLKWADSWRMMNAYRLPDYVVPNKALCKVLIKELKGQLEFLGKPERVESGVRLYRTPTETWQIVTVVDAGGRLGCSYHHDIETTKGVSLRQNLSLLCWLGVSSQSHWRVGTEPEVTSAVTEISRLCRHILDVALSLLSGLTIDS
jgi:hypothetical protein